MPKALIHTILMLCAGVGSIVFESMGHIRMSDYLFGALTAFAINLLLEK